MKKLLKKLFRCCPSFRQRDNIYGRQLAQLAAVSHVSQNLDQIKRDLLLLKGNGILSFPVHDKEIRFFLPYAGYDFMQNFIGDTVDFYEREFLEYCRRFAKPGMVIVDAGANIGNHTLFFSKFYSAAKVFAFEPQNTVFPILKRNIELNDCSNVEIFHAALGATSGHVGLGHDVAHSCGETSFCVKEEGEYLMTTIDELKLSRCDFIKIDVEGFQYDVLRGGGATIRACHPVIWIEMLTSDAHNDYDDYDAAREFELPCQLLKEFGYRLERKLSDQNWLFVYDQTKPAM